MLLEEMLYSPFQTYRFTPLQRRGAGLAPTSRAPSRGKTPACTGGSWALTGGSLPGVDTPPPVAGEEENLLRSLRLPSVQWRSWCVLSVTLWGPRTGNVCTSAHVRSKKRGKKPAHALKRQHRQWSAPGATQTTELSCPIAVITVSEDPPLPGARRAAVCQQQLGLIPPRSRRLARFSSGGWQGGVSWA